ncbi:hypothetical protein ICN10_09900 [Polynucleobacter sp. 86C-FISCH]|uniref:hypothetical protein n=1 Tax=Polynucleobacter sp. 86C-FISCH TaxID=2689101 RepID=UPI001C0CFCA8|nr:hypothetical protein [Polynucleobacter sp. 86C-FISCH]MBU3596711.1 hypothetical protein [Polynucleobacter sp. 86C-FISCH]
MLSILILIFSSLLLLALGFVFYFSTSYKKPESAGFLAISEDQLNIRGYDKFLFSEFSVSLLDGPGYQNNISDVLKFKDSTDRNLIGVANLRVMKGHIFAFMSNKIICRLSACDANNFLLTADIENLSRAIFLAPILVVRILNCFSDRDTCEVRLMPCDLAQMSRDEGVEGAVFA